MRQESTKYVNTMNKMANDQKIILILVKVQFLLFFKILCDPQNLVPIINSRNSAAFGPWGWLNIRFCNNIVIFHTMYI